MNHKKDKSLDKQNDTLFIEIVVWVTLFGFLYMCYKGIVIS